MELQANADGRGQLALRSKQAAVEGIDVHPPLFVRRQVLALPVLALHREEMVEVGHRTDPHDGEHSQSQFRTSSMTALPVDKLVSSAFLPDKYGLPVPAGQSDVVHEPVEAWRGIGRFVPVAPPRRTHQGGVARLALPGAVDAGAQAQAAVAQLRASRQGVSLGGLSSQDLRTEGRH